MWKKLMKLLVMEAPEWWDQPLDEFLAQHPHMVKASRQCEAVEVESAGVPAVPLVPNL
jgi:hypothetical protein